MDQETDLAKLMLYIDRQKERADHARFLAYSVPSVSAARNLQAYATELEAETEKLEARAAVMKQAADENAKGIATVAALKSEDEADPET